MTSPIKLFVNDECHLKDLNRELVVPVKVSDSDNCTSERFRDGFLEKARPSRKTSGVDRVMRYEGSARDVQLQLK